MIDLAEVAWLGVVAGVVPVYLGLIPLILMGKISQGWRDFVLSVTNGILIYLFSDVLMESVELSHEADIAYGPTILLVGLSIAVLSLLALDLFRKSHRSDMQESVGVKGGRSLAYMISLGIGLHNLGEGLAIGSSYAAGQISLSLALVVGFALHNGTEGFGIIAPISGKQINWRDIVLLGLLAGFPTVVGSIIGAVNYSASLATFFFAVAAGGLLYVLVELIRMIDLGNRRSIVISGILVGTILMYLTELLLEI